MSKKDQDNFTFDLSKSFGDDEKAAFEDFRATMLDGRNSGRKTEYKSAKEMKNSGAMINTRGFKKEKLASI